MLVDKLLDEKAAADHRRRATRPACSRLRARAAIANAKLAYEVFERVFAEPEFAALAAKGARAQRVAVGQHQHKEPGDLKDTYYAEALIGKHTVNTLPPATLQAPFTSTAWSRQTLHSGLEEAKAQIAEIAAAGIDLDAAMQKLQDDGVKLFADAFAQMLAGIDAKRSAIQARGSAVYVDPAAGYIAELIAQKTANRIWQRDTTLWTAQPEHIKVISNRLGWLSVAETMLQQVDALNQFREDVKEMGVTDAVVLGMGGSSMAPDVLRESFGLQEGGLMMHVLDTTDPTSVAYIEKRIDLRRTIFVVAIQERRHARGQLVLQIFPRQRST